MKAKSEGKSPLLSKQIKTQSRLVYYRERSLGPSCNLEATSDCPKHAVRVSKERNPDTRENRRTQDSG